MRETLLSYLPEFLDRGEDTALMGRSGLRTDYWSYRRLAQTAFQVARELGARGLVKGDRLVLWEDNSPAWVATFMGCLMRGVVVVPLDVQSSPEFVAGIERQTRPRLVLGGSPGASLEGLQSPGDSVAGFCLSAAAQPATPDWSYAGKVTGDHLAQIVFTSGTTAAPKGIRLTHRNLLSNLTPLETEIRKYAKWAAPVHPIRFLSLLPLSHVFGQMMGIFVPPLLGGQALFLNTLNPSEIISAIRRERISMLATVPRILELLRDKIERDEAARNRRPPLAELFERSAGQHWLRRWWTFRHVRRRFGWKFWAFLSGGATLDSGTEDFWKRMGYAVIQGYGMTETAAIISLAHPLRPGRGSIGKPMPGQEIKLDERGEILVRGRNISPGYWGAEEAPLTDEDGWLRTGDLGERDVRGNLYFRGRRKEVIVTSAGLNVYPGDIEAVLNQQPEIGSSAVVGVEGVQGPEPVAVLIMRSPEVDPSAAVQRANQGLSSYQQVRHWVVWPERDFPRTATQKVRKRDLVRFASRQGRDVPGHGGDDQDSLLGEILTLIEGITGTSPQRRDRQANLTSDLKLDSLARVALVTQLEDRLRMDLDESKVSEALTLGDLERLIGRPEGLSEDARTEAAPPGPETAGDSQAPSEARPDPDPARPDRENSGRSWRPYPYPYWSLRRPATWIRYIFQHCLIWPLTHLLCWTRVSGRRHWHGLREPVLVIANHVTFFDPALILARLPRRHRNRLAIAMIGERLRDFRYPPPGRGLARFTDYLAYGATAGGFNAFSLPRQTGFRRSFDYAGEAMDRGYSVLVFPEGARTKDGEMQPFQFGIGLLAAGLGAPVVPARIEGLYELKQRRFAGIHWPFTRPGQVSVTFGPPLRPSPSDSPQDLTRELEKRVRGLSRRKASKRG
ncbi:MAG: AMP-binding protein [Acidobacteriota bacterium]|nr:AMP-binding protein [Acidobacteriota bacterium]